MDVAARAGVSMKTVSRVLNNEAHVRPVLRERVVAAMAALDYRPNLAARQLAANRSFLISLVMQSRSLSYLSEVIVAAAAECRQHGYHLISETFEEAEGAETVVGRVLGRLRPDGIILTPPPANDPNMLAAIERTGTPLVRLAGIGEGYGTVVAARERGIAAEVVRHLLGAGRRRIGLIAPPEQHLAAQERVLGYRDALAEAGIPADPALIVAGRFDFGSGVAAAEQLLSLREAPDAIFATNDSMALGVLAAASRRGVAVPSRLAVAGFDDSPSGRMVYPALTTVRQPIAAMACNAVCLLVGKADCVVPTAYELIVRGSSSEAALSRGIDLAGDYEVGNALA